MNKRLIAVLLILLSLSLTSCSEALTLAKDELGINSQRTDIAIDYQKFDINLNSEDSFESELLDLFEAVQEFQNSALVGDPFSEEEIPAIDIEIILREGEETIFEQELLGSLLSNELQKEAFELVANDLLRGQLWRGFKQALTASFREKLYLENDCSERMSESYFGQQGISKSSLIGPANLICSELLKINKSIQELESVAKNSVVSLPKANLTTYVLDLSGSTFPLKQLESLGSGIDKYLSHELLGDPFSTPKKPPMSLSISFISANSANAPRILLASAETGFELNNWLKENSDSIEDARNKWKVIVESRKIVWDKQLFTMEECQSRVYEDISQLPIETLEIDYLSRLVCKDNLTSNIALERLNDFVENPNVESGSDVFGALQLAISNMELISSETAFGKKTLVFASDMVDEVSSREFRESLSSGDPCTIAIEDQFNSSINLQDFQVIVVGLGNSKNSISLIEDVRKYWSCYFDAGGADFYEASDLTGY